jgi:hypothetical protein
LLGSIMSLKMKVVKLGWSSSMHHILIRTDMSAMPRWFCVRAFSALKSIHLLYIDSCCFHRFRICYVEADDSGDIEFVFLIEWTKRLLGGHSCAFWKKSFRLHTQISRLRWSLV